MVHFLTRLIQTITASAFGLFFTVYSGLTVKGLYRLRKLDSDKGLIFAVNHNSQLDSVLVPVALLFTRFLPTYFVSLKKARYKRFRLGFMYGGTLFAILGARAIKLGLGDYSKTMSTHEKLINEGKNILIYPEGKIVPGTEIGKARGGVGYLAKATGAYIVPVRVIGDEYLDHKSRISFRAGLTVSFGKPVKYEELEQDPTADNEYKAAAQGVIRLIKEL